MPVRIPLTCLDEAFVDLGDTTVMSVQFEIRVAGTLDADRLSAAMRAAVDKHPIARARMVKASLRDTTRTWEISDEPDRISLEVVDGDPAKYRRRLQSQLPNLRRSPAFAARLVRDPDGDLLMFNFHHVAFDGMSAVRLVTSIARAYTDADDPVGGPCLDEARALRSFAGAQSTTELVKRTTAVAGNVLSRRDPIERVARQTANRKIGGYAFTALHLDERQTGKALQHKPKGCTVNDLLLAAMSLTIRRWNALHDAATKRRISIMMPVNIRPEEWSSEVVSNFASYVSVDVPASVPSELSAATEAVRDRTKPMKENQVAGWLVDLLEPVNTLPVVLKQNLQKFLPLVQDRFVDTTVLSNLGRLELPAFGDAGEVTEVWFSPPLFGDIMPVVLGAAGIGRELFLSIRTKRAAMDAEAAVQFSDLLRNTLING